MIVPLFLISSFISKVVNFSTIDYLLTSASLLVKFILKSFVNFLFLELKLDFLFDENILGKRGRIVHGER